MSSDKIATAPRASAEPKIKELLEQYGCGLIQFTGTGDALYERHLMFDNVIDAATLGPRERYEAAARAVRDVLSQRWLRTENTYDRENPKRVYYLSMEFLIGRSLANNVVNLLLDPIAKRVVDDKRLDWLALLEQEPDAGLGNGGLGRLAACFLDSLATMQIPAMGYLQADDRGWLATRAAGQLVAAARSVGDRPAAGAGGDQARLLVRGTRRQLGRDCRSAL
jgi:starch phosphorylase